MNHPLASKRARSVVATLSVGLFAVGSAGCGSDGASSADTSAPPTLIESTAAVTDTPTTDVSTSEAPTTTAATPETIASELTQDDATAIVGTILDAWNTDDVSPIEELMGPDDVWIAITGAKFDETTIAGWLDPILVAIGDTERTGDPVAVTDGFAFPLLDVSSGGPFFLIITRSADGMLTIEESPTGP